MCTIREIATIRIKLIAMNESGFIKMYNNPTAKNGRIFSKSFLCARLTRSTSSSLNLTFCFFNSTSSGFANV